MFTPTRPLLIRRRRRSEPGTLQQNRPDFARNQGGFGSVGGSRRSGRALAVDEDFGLTVEFPDGTEETVRSGEVSVRGLYGYAE